MKGGIPLHELSQSIRDKLFDSGQITNDERLGTIRKSRVKVSSKVSGNSNKQGKEDNIRPHFQKPVRIKLIHYRHKEPDSDACVVKWLIDALVEARLLEDDNRRCIPKRPEEEFVIIKQSEEERTEVNVSEV